MALYQVLLENMKVNNIWPWPLVLNYYF
jgi:hypothetical protein